MFSRQQEISSKLTSKLETLDSVKTSQAYLKMRQRSQHLHWAPESIRHRKLGKASLPPVVTFIV